MNQVPKLLDFEVIRLCLESRRTTALATVAAATTLASVATAAALAAVATAAVCTDSI